MVAVAPRKTVKTAPLPCPQLPPSQRQCIADFLADTGWQESDLRAIALQAWQELTDETPTSDRVAQWVIAWFVHDVNMGRLLK